MKYKLTSRAFTLIELLVVISIISLLASVVVASVTNAQAKSRDGKRTEDLVQFRNALELYGSNHDNKYPPVPVSVSTPGTVAYTSMGPVVVPTGTTPTCPASGTGWTSGDIGPDGNSAHDGNGLAAGFVNSLTPYLSTLPRDPSNNSNHCYIYTGSNAGSPDANTAVLYENSLETIPNPSQNLVGVVEGDPANYEVVTNAPALVNIIGVTGNPTLIVASAPVLSFDAEYNWGDGGDVDLTWQAQNATSCSGTGSIAFSDPGLAAMFPLAPQTSSLPTEYDDDQTFNVRQNSTITLTCTGPGGSTSQTGSFQPPQIPHGGPF